MEVKGRHAENQCVSNALASSFILNIRTTCQYDSITMA